MSKVIAIIQARTGSSRCPNKVMRPIYNNQSILEFQTRRLKQLQHISELYIATTEKPQDDCIVEIAKRCGVAYVRGPEQDTLTRFLLAIDESGADHVVRITSDSPCREASVIDRCILEHVKSGADYTRPVDSTLPKGMRCEVIRSESLKQLAAALPSDSPLREHVSLGIRQAETTYRHHLVDFSHLQLGRCKDFDFSVDTEREYEQLVAMINTLVAAQQSITLTNLCRLMAHQQSQELHA